MNRSPYPRKLPHFDVGQAYYHIIFRLREGYLSDSEIVLIRDLIKERTCDLYRLIAIQVMSNHVHLILQPMPGIPISRIVHQVKGSTARKVNKGRGTSGALWSDKYFDRVIRNQDDLEKTLAYMEQNSAEVGAGSHIQDYPGWEFVQD